MAQSRTKPRKSDSKPKATAAANGMLPASEEILTLAEAAAYLRFSEADILRLVSEQELPGRRMANEWRFLKSAIQDWLRTPPKPGSREAVLSTIGAWKDDPEMVAETMAIYHKRRDDLVENMQ